MKFILIQKHAFNVNDIIHVELRMIEEKHYLEITTREFEIDGYSISTVGYENKKHFIEIPSEKYGMVILEKLRIA
jgi:uncharacterized protein YkuJ